MEKDPSNLFIKNETKPEMNLLEFEDSHKEKKTNKMEKDPMNLFVGQKEEKKEKDVLGVFAKK